MRSPAALLLVAVNRNLALLLFRFDFRQSRPSKKVPRNTAAVLPCSPPPAGAHGASRPHCIMANTTAALERPRTAGASMDSRRRSAGMTGVMMLPCENKMRRNQLPVRVGRSRGKRGARLASPVGCTKHTFFVLTLVSENRTDHDTLRVSICVCIDSDGSFLRHQVAQGAVRV